MRNAHVSVRTLAGGRVLSLEPDSGCVPFPAAKGGAGTPRAVTVETAFEDLRCVSYSTSDGSAGYVASETPLGSRAPGEVVVVRTPLDRTHERWEVVTILPRGERN
jgi:hypothetical protein